MQLRGSWKAWSLSCPYGIAQDTGNIRKPIPLTQSLSPTPAIGITG
jgi:hypothetical protein